MIHFEARRWTRSRRLVIVCAAFAFSGMSAPLVAAYAEQILGAVQPSSNVSILVEDPTWRDGIASYLQNAAQLSLLVACYVVAWACALGSDERLQIFYRSRATQRWHLFLPRLIMSGLCVCVAASLGGLLAFYEVMVLFDGNDPARMLLVLTVQSTGLVTVALLAGLGAVLTNAPVVSALTTYFVVFFLDLFRDVSIVSDWTPIALLRPEPLLEQSPMSDYLRPGLAALALLAVTTSIALTRPVRATPHVNRSDR